MAGQIDLSEYALFRDFTDDAKEGCRIKFIQQNISWQALLKTCIK